MTFLSTVLRGLRSRALLSVASVLLTALAIGSAVLGPVFSAAATNSFLVTRLNDEPNPLTGLTWRFYPVAAPTSDTPSVGGLPRAAFGPTSNHATLNGTGPSGTASTETAPKSDPQQGIVGAVRATAGFAGPFAPPQTIVESVRISLGDVPNLQLPQIEFLAKDGACDHVVIDDGRCPTGPFDVMILAADADMTDYHVGTHIVVGGHHVTVTGIYSAPSSAESDYWFDLSRLATHPPTLTRSGTTPYRTAPFITPMSTFEQLDPPEWNVQVDRRLVVPPDFTLGDLRAATVTALGIRDQTTKEPDGTILKAESINDLRNVIIEVQAQQRTARNSNAPAVISLVLVALALLLRLLTAAADLRLPELALASLRGLSRRQLWRLGLSEPVALLVISLPAGAVIGVAMAWGLVRAWLVPGLPLPLPWTAWAAGVGVAAAGAVVAVVAVGVVMRSSLSEQLTGVRRPRRSSRVALVLQLVLVAGAVAILASKLSAGSPSDPDVTDLLLPVLLAVVAGLAATRGTAWTATWWTHRRRRTRSLPAFVAARAISRRQEGTLVILPVTAAIAVCVFGAGVYDSAAQWRASVAATIAPASEVWNSPMTLPATVDLTRRIDPDGRYLMAMSTLFTQGPEYTVADTSRLSRVASWSPQWTPGVSTGQIADRLEVHGALPVVRGQKVGLTLDQRTDGTQPVYVELQLFAQGGQVRRAYVGPFDNGQHTVTTDVPYCGAGCLLQALTVGGPAASPVPLNGTATISAITVDGAPVSGAFHGAGWDLSPEASIDPSLVHVDAADSGIRLDVESGSSPVIVQLSAGAIPPALPVVAGVGATLQIQGGAATSSIDFASDPVLTARSVPLLGPSGLLVDYQMLTTGRVVYDQGRPVYVLLRSDTPAGMRRALADNGVVLQTTLAREKQSLGQSAYALSLRLYAVVAALVLVMALAGLFVSTAVQLPSRRRDAASLRVVGVPRRSVMSAVLRELALVLGGTAVAGLAAGTLAQYVVLRTVTLGVVSKITTPALVAAIDPTRLAVVAAVTALLLGSVAVVSSALTVRGARGATLRESAR